MRAPRSRPTLRPARAGGALAALLLATGCAAAPAPSAPAVSGPPAAQGAAAPAAPAAPEAVPPADVAEPPVAIACGGELPGAGGPDGVLLASTLPTVRALGPTLGPSAGLGLALLGDEEAGTSDATCDGHVVLASADDAAARVLAATTAVLRDGPLLLLPGAAEPDALPAATRAVVIRRLGASGADERTVVESTDAGTLVARLTELLDAHPDPAAAVVLVAVEDVAAQADAIAHVPDGVRPLVVDVTGGTLTADGLAALIAPLRQRDPATDVRWSATSRQVADAFASLDVASLGVARWSVPVRAGGVGPAGALWLGDARVPGAALTAAATAARRGDAFVAVDGQELRAGVERTARIRALAASLPDGAPVVLVGGGEDASWQLDTVLEGTPLPDGGFLPLEDRRIVALYGSPGAPSLGILGEQDLEATLVRARELATAGYADAADGRIAVPGLDVITTVASSAAEPTGDYSRRISIERLRPLVDRAGEEGVAVILDLQPGRTDFLTQAKEYEELLLEPHVHLALDPEWRIGPTGRHLQRIGSVEAAEVQEVADWLAALVRRERLPQKVFMLHQFIRPMLPDRDTVVVPPELVGVVHVDGQGPLPTKDRTYAVMTDGAEERWAWGWKNFTRIDEPLATPAESLDRTPVPLVITYQ